MKQADGSSLKKKKKKFLNCWLVCFVSAMHVGHAFALVSSSQKKDDGEKDFFFTITAKNANESLFMGSVNLVDDGSISGSRSRLVLALFAAI